MMWVDSTLEDSQCHTNITRVAATSSPSPNTRWPTGLNTTTHCVGAATSSVAVSINDNPNHAWFPQEFDQRHLTQGPQAAPLPAGSHAHVRALVRGLPAKPAACGRNDAERGFGWRQLPWPACCLTRECYSLVW